MRRSIRKLKLRTAARTLWMRAAAIAIGCQFLVPAGYMPGALAEGTSFVLCHVYTGAPAAAHDTAAHDAHDADAHDAGRRTSGHEDHSDADAWENCPLGALGSVAAARAGPSR